MTNERLTRVFHLSRFWDLCPESLKTCVNWHSGYICFGQGSMGFGLVCVRTGSGNDRFLKFPGLGAFNLLISVKQTRVSTLILRLLIRKSGVFNGLRWFASADFCRACVLCTLHCYYLVNWVLDIILWISALFLPSLLCFCYFASVIWYFKALFFSDFAQFGVNTNTCWTQGY